jgi:hypothetical protein
MKRLLVLLLLMGQIGFAQSPYRIKMPSATDSARVTGVTGSWSEGYTYYGAFAPAYAAHEFNITISGYYKLYRKASGGSWAELSSWGGAAGRLIWGTDAEGRVESGIVPDDVTIKENTGGALQVDTTVIATRNALDYTRPEWFGAVADSVTDCRSAFVSAIATGKTVLLDRGNYYISNTISADTVIMRGLGRSVSKLIFGNLTCCSILQINDYGLLQDFGVEVITRTGAIQAISATVILDRIKIEYKVKNNQVAYLSSYGSTSYIYDSIILNEQYEYDTGLTGSAINHAYSPQGNTYIFNTIVRARHYSVASNSGSANVYFDGGEIWQLNPSAVGGAAVSLYDGNYMFIKNAEIHAADWLSGTNTTAGLAAKIRMENCNIFTHKYLYGVEGTPSGRDSLFMRNCDVHIDTTTAESGALYPKNSYIKLDNVNVWIGTVLSTPANSYGFIVTATGDQSKIYINNLKLHGSGLGNIKGSPILQIRNSEIYVTKPVMFFYFQGLGANSFIKDTNFRNNLDPTTYDFRLLSGVNSSFRIERCTFESLTDESYSYITAANITINDCIFNGGGFYLSGATTKLNFTGNKVIQNNSSIWIYGDSGSIVYADGNTLNKNTAAAAVTVTPGVIYQTTNFYNSNLQD